MDAVHDLVESRLRLDDLARPAPQVRQPAQEGGVDGLVDAEREDAQAARLLAYALEDLVLVADLAVGEEDEDAVAFGVGAGAAQLLDGPVQGLRHLGAAAVVDAGEELGRLEAAPVVGLD